jgi:hypothetical protein
MGEAHLAKDRRETVSFLGGSWRRMRTKTEAVKSIGEGMLRGEGGVWRARGLEILLRQICCSPSRWVSEGLPRSCCMLPSMDEDITVTRGHYPSIGGSPHSCLCGGCPE